MMTNDVWFIHVCLGLGFSCGFYANSCLNEREWLEYQKNVAEQNLRIEQEIRQKEYDAQMLADKAAVQAKSAVDTVRNHYQLIIDSLHDKNSGNQDGTSKNTSTAERVLSSRNKSAETDRAEFQRLYDKQLELAQECDITSAKYNALILYVKELSDSTTN